MVCKRVLLLLLLLLTMESPVSARCAVSACSKVMCSDMPERLSPPMLGCPSPICLQSALSCLSRPALVCCASASCFASSATCPSAGVPCATSMGSGESPGRMAAAYCASGLLQTPHVPASTCMDTAKGAPSAAAVPGCAGITGHNANATQNPSRQYTFKVAETIHRNALLQNDLAAHRT